MSASGDRIRIRIANVTLDLPVYRDAATTRALAQALEARIARIEQDSPRIDTQAFAIQAAMELAQELHAARLTADQHSATLAKALAAIADKLEHLAE